MQSGIGRRRAAALAEGSAAYAERRAEIIAAAAKVFREKGYRGTSLADVAESLDTDRASLYYYIGSKEELFGLYNQRLASGSRPSCTDPVATGMLTISQLADYVGVTVRAVRHYHQRGLLPEPERDASGYRRYGAQAVVDLIRIKTLSDAGVPLARIADLMSAPPAQFSRAVTDLDQALASRIQALQEQRHRISQLVAGDRLFLPADVAEYLSELRDLGVRPRTVEMERGGWILHGPVRRSGNRMDQGKAGRLCRSGVPAPLPGL